MAKDLAERVVLKVRNAKIIPQPRSIIENIEDHAKPLLRKKLDARIIHSGTNDISNGTKYKKCTSH